MDDTIFERYRDLIDDWGAFTEALARPLPSCVWANTTRARADEVERWLARCGLEATRLSWCDHAWRIEGDALDLGTLMPYQAGLYHTQEEVSLIPSWLLAPSPDDRVLDTCAAPGGKTAHLAAQMQGRGTVIANDRSYKRMRALRGTLDRLGLANVTMTVHDAANLPAEVGAFDRALVDVPCSCEGTSRKNPRVLVDCKRYDYDTMGKLQSAILTRALQLLRPGGELVYSTCTYAPEENECVIEDALAAFGRERVEIEPIEIPGFQVTAGLVSWSGRALDARLTRAVRVWPHHNDTGGFFVAKMRRCS